MTERAAAHRCRSFLEEITFGLKPQVNSLLLYR
jgi:hypothetical protein